MDDSLIRQQIDAAIKSISRESPAYALNNDAGLGIGSSGIGAVSGLASFENALHVPYNSHSTDGMGDDVKDFSSALKELNIRFDRLIGRLEDELQRIKRC